MILKVIECLIINCKERIQMVTDSSPGETKKTTEELVSEYMESEINVREIFSLNSGWEEEVYFDSIPDAWPGFKKFDPSGEEYLSEYNQYPRQWVEWLNDFYDKGLFSWETFLFKDNKGESFLALESKIPSTEERVIIRIKDIRHRLAKEDDPHYKGVLVYWGVESIIIISQDSKQVVSLDKFLKAPNSPSIYLKGLFGLPRNNEKGRNPVEIQSFNDAENYINLNIPNLSRDPLLALLHELGHATEASTLKDEILLIKGQAREIIKSEVEKRDAITSELGLEDASKILIKEERIAWAIAYKLLEIINKGSKSGNLQFGNYAHRLKLREGAEEALKTYDSSLKEKDLIIAGKMLGFSQEERAPKRSQPNSNEDVDINPKNN